MAHIADMVKIEWHWAREGFAFGADKNLSYWKFTWPELVHVLKKKKKKAI